MIEEGIQAVVIGEQLVAQGLQETGEWLNNPKISSSPGGFIWHHFENEGILKLVDRLNHRNNFNIYHPTGRGGRLGRMGKL